MLFVKVFVLTQLSSCRLGLWLVWMHESAFWQQQTQHLDGTTRVAQWNRTFNFLQPCCLVLTCCGWYRTDQIVTMICDWRSTSRMYTSTASSLLPLCRPWICSWCDAISLSARNNSLSFPRSSQITLWVSACWCFYHVSHQPSPFSSFHNCFSFVCVHCFPTLVCVSSLDVFSLSSVFQPGRIISWQNLHSLSLMMRQRQSEMLEIYSMLTTYHSLHSVQILCYISERCCPQPSHWYLLLNK